MHKYPETKQSDVVDTYFSTKVSDPYRWLEDDRSEETADWVTRQNDVTFAHLNQIAFRDAIRKKLETANNFEKVSLPFKHGDYTYFYKNDGIQNQAVLYRQKENDQKELGEAQIFLDPNTFSEEGTTSLDSVSFSKSDTVIAYSVSEGGSDWRTIYVIDAETGEELESPIQNAKFTGISWFGDEGFYYASYDKPEGSELSARTEQHKLYFHRLNTPQSEDVLVFGGSDSEKYRYVSGYTTEDNAFLVVSGAQSTSGNALYVRDLRQQDAPLTLVTDKSQADSYVVEHSDGDLLIYTNLDAPLGRVVKVNAQQPSDDNWVDLISEQEQQLNIETGAGYLFASYLVDVNTKVVQYRYNGEKVRDIELPGLGCVSGFGGRFGSKELYYSFTNRIVASSGYRFDPETGVTELHHQSQCQINSDLLESKQVFYTSKDGTRVPVTICYRKGLELNGNNPTMLYGYGGFNVSLEPRFSPLVATWIEMGGVYAVANLRGGGEYGKTWHIAGTKLQKQNVFDDFISAAEFLIDEGYTSPEKLAIHGGSNGGLLVGACMTQRPELFKVAIPAVGVLDMLRYHTFTSGEGWAYDYGTSEQNEEMFSYLKQYSPVHNVTEGTHYPATLVTTADHDDRVVPAHSFKFIAELQAKHDGETPVLIRVDTNAGHGAGMPMSKVLDLYADMYAFSFHHMAFEPNI
ncbi:prolyl oligopeptidase family serine peptidase [Vibrio gallicus]|uniref:prolyl oligopeptidase family serine peptidase n=1 Tax=Vibrio gallicus TaxID=190897 RepID=UPI0021C3890A|nr:prolyl oligopeptidase family serine peptidase [Vibrio gallicus]